MFSLAHAPCASGMPYSIPLAPPRGECQPARMEEEAWVRAGREKWPELALDPRVFLAHVARHADSGNDPLLANAADMWLACACANAVAGAHEAFERTLRDEVSRAVRRIDPSRAFADAVAQVLRTKMLVGDAPKIAEYAGRSSLRAWIRTAATRAALNLRRDARDDRRETLDPGIEGVVDEETAHLKRRYGAAFEAALESALSRLEPGHRTLLRMHYSERVPLERIAALYHVSRSTMARRIAEARESVVGDVQTQLRANLRLTRSEVDSLTAFVLSVVDVSVTRLLGA